MTKRELKKFKKYKLRNSIEVIYEGFITTSDDWAPNFPDDKVEVRVYVYTNLIGEWSNKFMTRICIHGADDTVMDRDEYHLLKDYDSVIENILLEVNTLPELITKAYLLTQGFLYD